MKDVQEVLSRLRRSPFRSRIHLEGKERNYLRRKGMSEVLKHAIETRQKSFISTTLGLRVAELDLYTR
jgi:hypothetical protein